MHVQGEGGGGSEITKSERKCFMDEPFVYRFDPGEICLCLSRLAKH